MRSLRGRFPRVSARRVWNLDGTPIWEFRYTSRRVHREVAGPASTWVHPILDAATTSPLPAIEDRRVPVRFVSSRGVEIGPDTLRIAQFHHRIRRPVTDPEEPFTDLLAGPESAGESPESLEVAPALVELAADPENESAQRRVIDRLAVVHDWFQSTPVLDVSAARITGEGLGHSLDGLFVWRAEGGPNLTYLVSPDSDTRALLAADPDLVQALIRAACPHPDDVLGELEISLREALTRLGVVDPVPVEGPGPVREARRTSAAELVLRVDPEPAERSEALDSDREKSDSERALSEELAELARKVGTASVRKPVAEGPTDRAREAG